MSFDRKAKLVEIASRQHDPDALGSYLITLVKKDEGAIELLEVYESLLFESDWYLKKVGLYALLFTFKLQNEGYKAQALHFLNDPDEDSEVRSWAATGLATCYRGTKDPGIMKNLMHLLHAADVGATLRNKCLQCLIEVWGILPLEIFRRASREVSHNDEHALTENRAAFDTELQQIQQYLAMC